MLILGIDPGISGALAILAILTDSPNSSPTYQSSGMADWLGSTVRSLQGELLDALRGRACRAVVERVSAMPRQGVASSFAFGVGFGSILATLQTLRLPIELVTPATWKHALGLSDDKRASLDKARLLFPTADLVLAKHDGRAEALLLAYYAQTRRREAAA